MIKNFALDKQFSEFAVVIIANDMV